MGLICSIGIKRGKNCQKTRKICFFFKRNARFLRVIRSNHKRITDVTHLKEIESNLLTVARVCSWSLFFKEQRDKFAHGRSLLKNDGSKSLIVALY